MQANQQSKVSKSFKKVNSSFTFKEGSLFKQALSFSFQIDKGAPNLYNNKYVIRNSIDLVKFSPQKINNEKQSTRYNNDTAFSSMYKSGYEEQNVNKMKVFDSLQKQIQNPEKITEGLYSKTNTTNNLISPRSKISAIGSSSRKQLGETQKVLGSMPIQEGLQASNLSAVDSMTSKHSNQTVKTLRSFINNQSKFKQYNKRNTFDGPTANNKMPNISRVSDLRRSADRSTYNQTADLTNLNLQNSRMDIFLQHTRDSRAQYLKNREYKTSQLIAPIDLPEKKDYMGFQSVQKNGLHTQLSDYKPMKNDQTPQFEEPYNRKEKIINQSIDFINSQVVKRPEAINNGKMRFVSDYYEQEGKAHFSPDYKQKVESFPILFSKKKTEFGKINNALPSTSLIIKSSYSPNRNF